ncbi:hypothetical protein L596_002400 [Steinernema carpocapsae]|uniref:Uncharacterized protein n=1 Tax=Steinernema carpocapsae TaxID=34508 RepID=A0A4U8UPM2_STECR|nr:hypothetical protein L596_002400 [Steinernema carpocapsae]
MLFSLAIRSLGSHQENLNLLHSNHSLLPNATATSCAACGGGVRRRRRLRRAARKLVATCAAFSRAATDAAAACGCVFAEGGHEVATSSCGCGDCVRRRRMLRRAAKKLVATSYVRREAVDKAAFQVEN